jgi:hypothetical protein
MWRAFLHSGAAVQVGYFVVYETVRKLLLQTPLGSVDSATRAIAAISRPHLGYISAISGLQATHVIAGGIGGGTTAALATPFDTIKARMQTGLDLHCIRATPTRADPEPNRSACRPRSTRRRPTPTRRCRQCGERLSLRRADDLLLRRRVVDGVSSRPPWCEARRAGASSSEATARPRALGLALSMPLRSSDVELRGLPGPPLVTDVCAQGILAHPQVLSRGSRPTRRRAPSCLPCTRRGTGGSRRGWGREPLKAAGAERRVMNRDECASVCARRVWQRPGACRSERRATVSESRSKH